MMTIEFSQDTYTVKPGESVNTHFDLLPYGVADIFFTFDYAVNPDNVGISIYQNGKVTVAETDVPGTEATLMPILVLEVTMGRSIFHPLKLFVANK